VLRKFWGIYKDSINPLFSWRDGIWYEFSKASYDQRYSEEACDMAKFKCIEYTIEGA
jgi:hypothetical protein